MVSIIERKDGGSTSHLTIAEPSDMIDKFLTWPGDQVKDLQMI